MNDVLANTNFWGEDLTAYEGFAAKVFAHADAIAKNGMEATLKNF